MSIAVLLLRLLCIPSIVHAASDFLLTCGSNGSIEENGLTYLPDADFIAVGNATAVKESGVLPRLSSLRYFPDISARKYCYVFPVTKGERFLVKTTYYYGDFDGEKEPPVFDQIVDGTRWSFVNTTADYRQGRASFYELVLAASSDSMSVCLARNDHTVASPFISSLELHQLDDSVYNSTDFSRYALITVARNNFGSAEEIISYPDDKFNRFWLPFLDNNPVVLGHSNVSHSTSWNMPPLKAFSISLTTSRGKTLTVGWPPFPLPSSHYYIALYFHDNRTPSPNSWRIQRVSVNGELFFNDMNVTAGQVSIYSKEWPLSGNTEIELSPRKDMPVGPVISAGEIFQILPLGGRTAHKDAKIMEELANSFDNRPSDWNLTSFGLQGKLPASLANLTALTEIRLGHNRISGKIPDLSHLKGLKVLHLEGNQLEGQVPESVAKLPELREIYLQNNNLTIPKFLISKKGIKIQVSPGNHLV